MENLKEILHKNLLQEIQRSQFVVKYNITKHPGRFVKTMNDIKLTFALPTSGNEYEMTFFVVNEPSSVIINGKPITEINQVNSAENSPKFAYVIAPAFTIKGGKDISYDKLTNNDEIMELFGSLIYIINEFLKKFPQFNILELGKHHDKQRLNAYLDIFENQFSDIFNKYESDSDHASPIDKAFYFIKK